MRLHGKPDRERTIVVVAPPGALIRVVRRVCDDGVMLFTTAAEFEVWAAVNGGQLHTIRSDVVLALEQIGCRIAALPQRLRSLIDLMADRPHAPRLRDLARQWDSRRSLYRNWRAAMPESPGAFLRRVRALHARRLLAEGWTRKQAVAAGFKRWRAFVFATASSAGETGLSVGSCDSLRSHHGNICVARGTMIK